MVSFYWKKKQICSSFSRSQCSWFKYGGSALYFTNKMHLSTDHLHYIRGIIFPQSGAVQTWSRDPVTCRARQRVIKPPAHTSHTPSLPSHPLLRLHRLTLASGSVYSYPSVGGRIPQTCCWTRCQSNPTFNTFKAFFLFFNLKNQKRNIT